MFHHTPQTHYEVLGIGPYADISEIKSAYKARALETHPDKNGGTPKAKEAFQHLVNAYDVLSDVTKRKLYDQTLPRANFSQSWFSHTRDDESTLFGAATWPTQPPPSSYSSDPPNPFEPFTDDKSAPWCTRYEEEKRTFEEMKEEANERAKEREFSQPWFSHIRDPDSTLFGAPIRPTQLPPSSSSSDRPKPFEPFTGAKSTPWRERYDEEKRTFEEMEEEANERARERERMEKEAEELWVMGWGYTMYRQSGGRTSRNCGRGIGKMV